MSIKAIILERKTTFAQRPKPEQCGAVLRYVSKDLRAAGLIRRLATVATG